jgi:adenosyl cobinamide kinase/adenosyl cobinamide phosphate guanylyltransferase
LIPAGLTLLLGGARSGKSRLAVALAAAQPGPVTVIATAEARDAEMAARIDLHRAQRPADWTTIEEPLALPEALEKAAAAPGTVIVDCLTVWVSNLIEAGHDDDEIGALADRAARLAARSPASVVAVTNEVGWGLVPVYPLGRRFRDVAGRVNAAWSAVAQRAFLVVAGRVLPLLPAESIRDVR